MTVKSTKVRRTHKGQESEAGEAREAEKGGGPHRSLALITYFPHLSCAFLANILRLLPLNSEVSCRTEHAMTAHLEVLQKR